jgi:glucose/arabinose dehydrogenase
MLVTERPGRLVHLERDTRVRVSGVEHVGEGGLLGVAVHPNFADNRFLYLYQTTQTESGLRNRVVRYTYRNEQLEQDRIIIDELPGARYHDGGRIAFGPSEYLWVAVGDATNAQEAQHPEALHGSILRLNPDGSIPTDNPFAAGERGHPAVYSYGHRNPQGLTWDGAGRLWSTEHGRSGLRSGMDEVNMITAGVNYGWPVIEGNETREGMTAPVVQSGPDVTWAPASALYHDGSVFFGGLRGASLYEAVLDGTSVQTVHRHLHDRFGRLRSVVEGPDGYFYITTSNTDGRGSPVSDDDRVIRVHPDHLKTES